MIPVKQNRVAPKIGNCAAACLASVLEISLSDTFDGDARETSCHDDGVFWETMRSWLHARNLMWVEVHKGPAPFGYSIAIGPSPRLVNKDGSVTPHACVALNGELVH